MTLRGDWLLDTSVWARLPQTAVRAIVDPLRSERRLWTCDVVEIELGVTARTVEIHARNRALLAALPHVPVDPAVTERALAVQQGLVGAGHHRGVRLPDLDTSWVVPRGTVS